jgi:Uma2 family endonuclease
MADAGVLGDRHVELIDGELFELTTNPPHDTGVYVASKALEAAFGAGVIVRVQMTLDLGRRNQPQPDALVADGGGRDFAAKHPTPEVTRLILEVSESSLAEDRLVKAHRYAQAGIADYWIVNLIDRQLEIHRNPGPDLERKGRFKYHEITIVPADGHASPLAKPDARIAVADLLP